MRFTKILAFLPLIVATVLFSHLARAAHETKTLEIGTSAPDFDLPAVDGKRYSLADFKDAKILVIVFTCNHCPAAQAYESRLITFTSDYKDKSVAVVAINPNDPNALRLDELSYTDLSDSFDEMKIRAKDRGFNFPYLYDGDTQKTAIAYGVLATPHVFIFDAQRKLQYQGRFDDSDVNTPRHNNAREAVDALLGGKPVPDPMTNVFGCSTKWAEKSDSARKLIAKWDAEPVTLDPIDVAEVRALVAFELKDGASQARQLADAKAGKSSGRAGRELRLINVWATWCGPCVAELPELVTIRRQYQKRGLDVVTISMDEKDARDSALKMLTEKHLSARNYLYNGDDRDALVAALDQKWRGPVPYTVLIAPGGEVLYRQTGAFDPLELKKAIVGYLGRTY